MAGIPLFQTSPWVTGVFYAVLGFLFGVLAERTTYCIVIATHQVMGVRYSKIYEMILMGIAVSALLTGVLVAVNAVPYVDAYVHMPGAGWFTVLGSFIFGFGIMLGQGCMVGMLWKSGQGYVTNWLEIIGMMVGTMIFAFPIYNGLSLEWWWHHNTVLSIANGSPYNYVPFLLTKIGSDGLPINVTALIAGIVFFIAIMFVVWRLRRNRLEFEGHENWKNSPLFYGTLFGLFMVASFIFLAGRGFNYLGVTTPVGLLAEYVSTIFGFIPGSKAVPLNWFQTVGALNPFTFFILMVVSGAMLASMYRGTFAIRLPPPNTNRFAELAIAFIGGILLAIGARIAQGCSVGGFWSGLAGLSLFGLLFTLGFIPGTIAGYYAYVYLSSLAARRVKMTRITVSQVKFDNRIPAIIFSIVWGLIMIGVGFYVIYVGPHLAKAITESAAVQYGDILIGTGILVAISGILINLAKMRRKEELAIQR